MNLGISESQIVGASLHHVNCHVLGGLQVDTMLFHMLRMPRRRDFIVSQRESVWNVSNVVPRSVHRSYYQKK